MLGSLASGTIQPLPTPVEKRHDGMGMYKLEFNLPFRFQVEVIFHGAATLRFNEPLQEAVYINVRGTREMMLLARACSKLKAMVHISTAYR